jgi:hypothetical protein
MRLSTVVLIGVLLLAVVVPASAGPITVGGPWYEFGFGATGSFAVNGSHTSPSSGGNSVQADDPPWTFTASAGGVLLTVTDAFNKGDAFTIFDNAVSIGSTPLVAQGGVSVSDPAITVLDPTWSHAEFLLGPGSHSITIQALASPYDGGAGYFRADVIPAPGALLLLGSGLFTLLPWRRRVAR